MGNIEEGIPPLNNNSQFDYGHEIYFYNPNLINRNIIITNYDINFDIISIYCTLPRSSTIIFNYNHKLKTKQKKCYKN